MLTSDRLSLTFSALADPTRRAILARLSTGAATVNELAAPFAMSLPAVSKHLKVLERAQLIARGKEAQWRPCEMKAEPVSYTHLDVYKRQVVARAECRPGRQRCVNVRSCKARIAPPSPL